MKKYIILIISIFLICGCEIKPQIEKEEQVIDGLNFKVEYEKYNSTKYQLNIEKDNNFKYLDMNNINNVFYCAKGEQGDNAHTEVYVTDVNNSVNLFRSMLV